MAQKKARLTNLGNSVILETKDKGNPLRDPKTKRNGGIRKTAAEKLEDLKYRTQQNKNFVAFDR